MVKSNTEISIIRPAEEAKSKQRKTLYNLLSKDDEYTNLHDHIMIDSGMEKSLDSDVKAETKLTSVQNVMRLIHYDIQGYGMQAIAALMKMTEADVQSIRRAEAYKSAKDAVMAEIINMSRRVMEVSAIKAVKTLTECMESSNDKVKLSAAVEVLNRTGLTATQKIELTTTNNTLTNYTDDELAEIIRGSIQADSEVITNGSK